MPLQELIYTSLSSEQADKDEAKKILTSAQRNNAANSITGLLMFDGQRYIQILEGEAEHVMRLYNIISKDPRHQHIELLHIGGITARSFDNWRMAYEALPSGLLDELAENMAVSSMELNGAPIPDGESFGARLNVMFMDAMAAK